MPDESALRNCPNCGAEDALETFLRIDLDDVVLAPNAHGEMEMVSFTLAGSANNPFNGIVVEEARISCRDCGHEVEGVVPYSVSHRWSYREDV